MNFSHKRTFPISGSPWVTGHLLQGPWVLGSPYFKEGPEARPLATYETFYDFRFLCFAFIRRSETK